MNIVKLGKKGQISIPRAILESLGVEGEQMLLIEATDDGAILLRPAGIYPVEIYSDERVREFLEEEVLPEHLRERVKKTLAEQGSKQ